MQMDLVPFVHSGSHKCKLGWEFISVILKRFVVSRTHSLILPTYPVSSHRHLFNRFIIIIGNLDTVQSSELQTLMSPFGPLVVPGPEPNSAVTDDGRTVGAGCADPHIQTPA